MNWLAELCMLSFGWRRTFILLGAGALAALSMPPFFLIPTLFIAFPIWVWCLDGAEVSTGFKRLFGPAFFIGFWFGLGYFIVAIHWVGAAFFVDGGWYLAAMPFAVLALAAVLAIFWGLSSALAHIFWSHGASRVLALAAALTIGEFARGHVMSGFPFDLLGYALTANDAMRQLASVIGIYGLTALVAVLATLPALIWPAGDRGFTRRLVPFFAIVVVFAGQIGFGQYRLNNTSIVSEIGSKLRLVQPAIDQSIKWQAESHQFIMDRLLTLSTTKLTPDGLGLEGVDAVVWPESAMPFYLSDHPEELARIARMLPADKYLITGAPRQEFGLDSPGAAYNSILAINTEGEVVASYDKTHLVPIGEYLPFKDFARGVGLMQFVPGAEGWEHGEGRRVMTIPGLPSILPLICYEILFSGDLGAALSDAEFILNLTNDGWFDGSVGLAQHFNHARLRAVEEGKSLVRVANTGITGVVDPLGRIVAQVNAGEVGVLDVRPPDPIDPPLFARLRHWPVFGFVILVFVYLIWQKRRFLRT